MPVFRSGKGLAPPWCELEYFEIVALPKSAAHAFERIGRKEKLLVGTGRCRIAVAGREVVAEERANLDLNAPEGQFQVLEALSDATLIRMCGRWGDETGGSGIFTARRSDSPRPRGDAVPYPKATDFDNHYHDCDEYWILFEGRGVAVSEGKSYEVGPGDCVATGRGFHHDFPQVFAPVKAVYFETTMEGEKRRGHLWTHQHGPPKPKVERV